MPSPPKKIGEQIDRAYREMAALGYRPAAPSDGFGNIQMPVEELDLDAECLQYAEDWWEREERGNLLPAVVADYPTRPGAIVALEAVRLMCAGRDNWELATKLLMLASGFVEAELIRAAQR